jgi:cation diffusion facilitator CzcD-associated flavoprotein CzcO
MARDIPEKRRALFRRFPLLMRAYRIWLWSLMDLAGVLSLRRGSWLHRQLEKAALDFLDKSVADPLTRAKLTPDYAAGCKRRCIADDYLETFNRDNVHLVTDGIAHIEANGIRDATGTLHAVDTIIEATGFKPFDITDYVDIRGRDGRRLRDAFAARVESFRSVMVPGFPNFFLLLGPNSATGHTSALIMIESQANYVISCMNLMEKQGIAHLDPRRAATERFNRRIQRDMKKMVFSGGCSSWYTDKDDVNFTLWPYSALRFVMELHRPLRDELEAEYVFEGSRDARST